MIPLKLSRKLKIGLAIVALVFAPYLAFLGYVAVQGNFHAITPGKAYRSGQLGGPALGKAIEQYGIKSIVNLRGADDARWYREEMRVSGQYKIKHYDIDLSSLREPKEADRRELEEILRTAPLPILIHCRVGADRTGLASAMWKVLAEGASKEEASKQLALKYGHLAIGGRFDLDRFFDRWTPLEPLHHKLPAVKQDNPRLNHVVLPGKLD